MLIEETASYEPQGDTSEEQNQELQIELNHMGQYPLLSVLSDRLSPLNIDHSRNLPVEICGINYTEKYTNL